MKSARSWALSYLVFSGATGRVAPRARPGLAARSGSGTVLWTLVAAAALLWPARIVGVLDGVPLDGRAEALITGLVMPAVWWLDRRVVTTAWARGLIVALLLWKIGTNAVVQQQGLCATASASRPLDGTTMTIRIEEPSGALRSWDMRANWRDPRPACTAIITRPLHAIADFPAWYLNLTDEMLEERDVTLALRGHVSTAATHLLTVGTASGVELSGRVDETAVGGDPIRLGPGTHGVDLTLRLRGDQWRFEPALDGTPLWDRALVTTGMPGAADRLLASWGGLVAPVLVLALLCGMIGHLVRQMRPDTALVAWTMASVLGAALLASLALPAAHRAAGLIGLGAVLVPIRPALRNLRTAAVLIGAPWLTFFAVWSADTIGRFSMYSQDDWLAYQAAGYRIFMNGAWLEAGTPFFDYQPFYRWLSGALHMLFGDSSVGELYWDAACLLTGALLAFQIVRSRTGFRWGIVAASATTATFTLGTPWHFLGRGLSEIAAAGFASLAMFFLLRARRGGDGWIAAAALMAVLMFYSRLNHLLWALLLPAMLLPLRTPATAAAVRAALARVRRRSLALFALGVTVGILLFVVRTWYYTGVWTLFYGTSLRHNDTGLRPWTVFDLDVWARVAHSLASFVFLNEPPRPDPRALVMVAGVLVGIAALLQHRVARHVPGALVLTAAGASLGAFFAHAHPYPGRFSIHAVPLASAVAAIAVARGTRR